MQTIEKLSYFQARRAAETLSLAFVHDPLVAMLCPQENLRRQRTRALFAFNARYCALCGSAMATHGDEGVALWLPGKALQTDMAHWLLCGGAMISWSLGENASSMLQYASSSLDQRRSAIAPGDFYYLSNLGVLPQYQRQGIGRSLLEPVLERCAAQGQSVLVETNTPDALAFYRAMGFVLRDQMRIFQIVYYFLQFNG